MTRCIELIECAVYAVSRVAISAGEVVDVLRAEWVDVILTDINMPVMDGEEFARQLAADDVLRSISILVVSTDCTQARIHQMLVLGARGYVTKPFYP